MAYSPPVGSAADFVFAGKPYVVPAGGAVDFDFYSVPTLRGSGAYALGGAAGLTYGTRLSAAGAVAVYGAASFIAAPTLVIRDKFWLGGSAEIGFPYWLIGTGECSLAGAASIRAAATLFGTGALSLNGAAKFAVPTILNAFGPIPLVSGSASFLTFTRPALTGVGKFAPLSGSASLFASVNINGEGSVRLSGQATVNSGTALHVASRYSLGGLANIATGAIARSAGKFAPLAGFCALKHGVSFDATGSVFLMGEAEMTHNHAFPIYGSGSYELSGDAVFSFPVVTFDDVQFITTHQQRIEVFTDV